MEDVFGDEFDVRNGTAVGGIPIQKGAVLDSVTMELKAEGPVKNPSLFIDLQKVWEFDGDLGMSRSFVEGEELTFELGPGEERGFNLYLPNSTVGSSHIDIERTEGDQEYDVSMSIDGYEFWQRSMMDDLFGPLEQWVARSNLRAADTVRLADGTDLLVYGGSSGRIIVRDVAGDTDFNQTLVNGEAINEVVWTGPNGNNMNGVVVDFQGDIFTFTFNLHDHELTTEYVMSTHFRNEYLLKYDLTGNEYEDVITLAGNDLMVGYNDVNGLVDNFTILHAFNQRPEYISFTDNGEFVVSMDDGTQGHIHVFEYDNGELIETAHHAIDTRTSYTFGIEFTGDGELDYLVRSKSTGSFEVWSIDGTTGNLSRVFVQEISHWVHHVSVGDLTGNGLHDFAVSGHFTNNPVRVYINRGEGFEREFTFHTGHEGRKVYMRDIDGAGDLDLLIVTKGAVHVARNRRIWSEERVSDFHTHINNYRSTAESMEDQWGNPMVTVPFTLRSQYAGTFTLRNPRITYDYRPSIDVTDVVKGYMDTEPESELGMVSVPVTMTADDDVTFTVETTVRYLFRGPLMRTPIPDSYNLRVEESARHLMDLSEYFFDPTGQDLTYMVTYQEDRDMLGAVVDGNRLNFNSGDATGSWGFVVRAINPQGYTLESNEFRVHVVENPPVFVMPSRLNVRAGVTTWFPLEDYISGLEPFEDLSLSTNSAYITAHTGNMTLEMLYTNPGYSETVKVTLQAGPYEVDSSVIVVVKDQDEPFFRPLPNILIEKNEALGAGDQGSTYLPDYVDHPDGGTEGFTYSIVTQTRLDIVLVSISNGYVVAEPEEEKVGESRVTVRVSHGGFSDDATFTVTVNNTRYPPEYVGDLRDVSLVEGESWTVDLRTQFEYAEPWRLTYTSSHEEVKIVNQSWALWKPVYGDETRLENVVFTAADRDFPGLNDRSPPVNMEVEWLEAPPEYTGGLHSRVVMPNETWEVNLFNHFTHREDPSALTFTTNRQEISIAADGNASWTPSAPGDSLRNITFTADYMGLETSSPAINLIVPLQEYGPFCWIESPETGLTVEHTDLVSFVAETNSTQGNITYEWSSSIDGFLTSQKEFDTLLSQGTHTITLRVRDERGEWSQPDSIEITVERREAPPVTAESDRTWIHIGIFLMIIGLSLNFAAYEIKGRRSDKS